MKSLEDINEKVERNTERIDALEKHDILTDSKLDNLCEKLESLTSVLKYVAVTMTGAFVTLLIFLIEKHI